MPFTLAHPAAVLPLKPCCPRFLNFAALVAGSMAPDAGYCFGRLGIDRFSHSFLGSIVFCLPVGALMLAFFYALRSRVVALLPEADRQIFLPLCRQPVGSLTVIAISLLLGAWTHLLWDSFTHPRGGIVRLVPLLQSDVAEIASHHMQVCHLLWFASSFVGIAWLFFHYETWRRHIDHSMAPAPVVSRLCRACLVALLFVPVEAMHYFVSNPMLFVLLGLATTAVPVGVVLIIGNTMKRTVQTNYD